MLRTRATPPPPWRVPRPMQDSSCCSRTSHVRLSPRRRPGSTSSSRAYPRRSIPAVEFLRAAAAAIYRCVCIDSAIGSTIEPRHRILGTAEAPRRSVGDYPSAAGAGVGETRRSRPRAVWKPRPVLCQRCKIPPPPFAKGGFECRRFEVSVGRERSVASALNGPAARPTGLVQPVHGLSFQAPCRSPQ